MSTTGDRSVGRPRPDIAAMLTQPAAIDRAGVIEQGLSGARAVSSPGFPFDEEQVRARIEADYDRAYQPAGRARQLMAIVCSPDRTPDLSRLRLPTLVVHGEDDPLVDVSGGGRPPLPSTEPSSCSSPAWATTYPRPSTTRWPTPWPPWPASADR